VNSRTVDKATGVRADQTIVLTGINTAEHYPDKLQTPSRPILRRREQEETGFPDQRFLPSPGEHRLALQATVAGRTLLPVDHAAPGHQGVLRNFRERVKTQVWVAISVYVLVAIVKKRLHLMQSLYIILQILNISVFEKEPLFQILTNYEHSGSLPEPDNQLNLFK
jgi:hypothetical protein